MVSTLEYMSGSVRVKNTVTKDENGPETVEQFLDRAQVSHETFLANNPPD